MDQLHNELAGWTNNQLNKSIDWRIAYLTKDLAKWPSRQRAKQVSTYRNENKSKEART